MSQKERWATRVGLVLAMAGNAVGLGNFLRFPAQAAKNGGGAFLIPYFVALAVVGLPLIWVEWAMGRFGGQHGHHSAPGVFQSHSKNPIWKYFGVLGLWSCLVIASYYLYIETWCLAYAGNAILGGFQGKDLEGVGQFFAMLTGEKDYRFLAFSPLGLVLFLGCITLNIYILSRGLAKGIELVCKVGMPLLLLFAAILAVRGLMINPDTDPEAKTSALEGLNFVWQPKYESLADPSVWLAAAGQIFFTLSIGMGSIHCYSSYLREKDDIALTGQTAAWTNEFCEVVLGGTILIPIAVAYLGLAEVESRTAGGSGGFGLGFFVFPTLFNKWGAFAPVAGFLWFGLLFFAAITSSLAMGQPIMSFFQQEFGMTRERSARALAMCLLPLAIPVAFLHSNTFNDEFDYWAGTVMLVVFALAESILFAWVFGMERGWQEIFKGAEIVVPKLFYHVIRFVTPAFLAIIFVSFAFKPVGKVTISDPKTGKESTQELGWRPYITGLFTGGPFPEWEWAGDGMVGKLLHRDVPSVRDSKLAGIDRRIQELEMTEVERKAKMKELELDIARVKSDSQLRADQREKKVGELEAQIKKLQDDAAKSPDKVNEELAELRQEREQAVSFYDWLPVFRNIDRLVMLGVYLFFCTLVWIAWTRRAAKGSA